MKTLSPIVAAVLVVVGVVLLFGWVWLYDPLNWRAVTSDRFSWAAFRSVKAGEDIRSVVAKLGPPVHPPSSVKALYEGPCYAAPCREYRFSTASGWSVAPVREAIVIADVQGRVVQVIERIE